MKNPFTLALPPNGVGDIGTCDQQATGQKLAVGERMAKARAAKAEKKRTPPVVGANAPGDVPTALTLARYSVPVDKVIKGPRGEPVKLGERGATYYVNKNGNKTYLSSNQ